jgi:predicted nuclease with TOPRIM domain
MNKAKKEILRKFRKKNFAKSEKFRTFADEEPTALAYTDFSKPMPILEGEDAERFIRIMEENDRKAAEKAKLPPTREELERELSCSKIMLDFQEREVEQLRNRIKDLETQLNGKTEEE